MKSSMNSKQNSSSPSPKNKKNSKDREKRRPEYTQEHLDNAQLVDIAFVGDTAATNKYARLERESILNIAEQCLYDQGAIIKSNEVTYSLAEDLSYKLRHIIHESMVKANLSGRLSLMACDVEATFESLSIDKVYGAPNNYNFIRFSDKNLYYLDDSLINLVELAEETGSLQQPHSVIMTKKCYPELTANALKSFKTYFDGMCRALVSNESKQCTAALLDIQSNSNIIPIINWFYQFAYILLDKDIVYNSLTMHALYLIRALERNHFATQFVSEQNLKLLTKLLLQRIYKTTSIELIQPMCGVLTLLCTRIPLMEIVMKSILQKMKEMKKNNGYAIICILNELGAAAYEQLSPDEWNFIWIAKNVNVNNADLNLALLRTYRIVFGQKRIGNMKTLQKNHKRFYDCFHDALTPLWANQCACVHQILETNSRNIDMQLFRNRRSISLAKYASKVKMQAKKQWEDVFDSPVGSMVPVKRRCIRFKESAKIIPVPRSEDVDMTERNENSKQKPKCITIGSRTTYLPLSKVRRRTKTCQYHLFHVL